VVGVQASIRSRTRWWGLAIALAVAALIALGGARYSLSPIPLLEQSVRIVAARVLSVIYGNDMKYVVEATERYRIGAPADADESTDESWRRIERVIPGLMVVDARDQNHDIPSVPFVYESPDVAYLRDFRTTYRLDAIVEDASDEYEAMLLLAHWVGTRWDHGTDQVAGGNRVCDPVAVVRAGEWGSKFWCEIAARTMVHAATAVGWQARIVTASRDGYAWEHAVAELWSNQFRKWFIIDADFNVVFHRDGVPLSAFELVHEGERLQAAGKLEVVAFAAQKPSLPPIDLIPYFAYIHLDMRNDWCTRVLRRGSPAGGDVATWWTSRTTLGPILTASQRVDDPQQFNWPVNVAALRGIGARPLAGAGAEVAVEVTGYGPDVEAAEVSRTGGNWRLMEGTTLRLSLTPGRHEVAARLALRSGGKGPETRLVLDFAP